MSSVVYKGTTYTTLSDLISAFVADGVRPPSDTNDFHDAFLFTKLNEKTGTGFNTKMSDDGTEIYIVGTNNTDETLTISEYINGLSVTKITDYEYRNNAYAFDSNYFLNKVSIPDDVKTIEYNAFSTNYQLEELSLGSGLEKISEQIAYGCTVLKDINYNGTKDQWNNLEKEDCWEQYVPDTCIIHCTDGDLPIRPVNVFDNIANFFDNIGDAITSGF